jgi:hypothetical protein
MDDSDRFHHEVMAQLQQQEIVTTCVRPALPIRNFDWQAVRKGAEPGDLAGFGATEQEAIEALLELESAK